MNDKKIYCEIVNGVTYSSRCLWRLSKVIEGNPTCEECILRQPERLKSAKANVSDDIFISSDIKTSSNIPDGGIRKGRGKRGHKRRSKLIRNETSSQAYSVRELGELLGKAKRTIQDYAKKGRIPARRIGKSWCFPKEEIDRWFSERKDGHLETSREKDEEEPPEFQKSDFLHANQGESEKGV